MADRPSAVAGVFRRPFREQAAFFRGKLANLVPTRRWDDLTAEEHDTAFMVAGAQKADLLADLAAAVDRAIVEGKSLDAFRKDFAAAVERDDWHGWTGEDTAGGRAWRTRTIYRTNATASYAAGRFAQLQAGNFAFWIYRHGGSQDPRIEHLSWNGWAGAPDHPFWVKHYPPSDWGCSCYVVGARTAAGVRRMGGDPAKTLPAGWDKRDPRTGEPAGIGKGWGYAPGARVAQAVEAAARKVGGWEYQIGKAFMAELPNESRDAIARAYRRLPSVQDDLRRYAERTLESRARQFERTELPELKTLGALTEADIAAVRREVQLDATGYDFSLARSDIGHVDDRHGPLGERTPGQRGVTPLDFARLPAVVASPDRIVREGLSDAGEQVIRYERTIGGERFVAMFAVRGRRRRTLALKTLYIQRPRGG